MSSSSDQTSSVINDPEQPDAIDYKPVSRSAIVCLFLGLASVLSVGNMIFMVIPAVGVLVSLVTRSKLAKSPQTVGSWMATAGLILSVVFASWGGSWTYFKQRANYEHARQRAAKWLEAVASHQFENAFNTHHQSNLSEGTEEDIAEFFEDSLLKTIADHGQDGRFRYRGGAHQHTPRAHTLEIAVNFDFEYESEGKAATVPLQVLLQRTAIYQLITWQVLSVRQRAS